MGRVRDTEVADSLDLRLGRYEILAELGRGTAGVVYMAWDYELGRMVAVKILRLDPISAHESDAALKRRFLQEAVAAGRLTHPSIVTVHDVGELDAKPYIVMEYVEGRTLADVIAANGKLPSEEAVRLVMQVCEAIEYAHGQRVVHRDIKPSNILVAADGAVKVTDFGIARIAGAHHTQTGAMLGTPAYMSPEQVKGEAADARSDEFALGVVLYEALTGVSPFKADDLAAVLYQIVHVEPVPLRQQDPSLSPALEAVVARALAKEPAARYPSAKAFANALTQALASPTAPLEAPGHASERPRAALATRLPMAAAGAVARAALATCLRRMVAAGVVARVALATHLPMVAAGAAGVLVLSVGAWASWSRLPAPGRTVELAAPGPGKARILQPTSGESACMSVNAIPFATVYVDGRFAGYTPKACLRISLGDHRVHFRTKGQRSPERLINVTSRHTPDDPIRVSYDFTSGQFVAE